MNNGRRREIFRWGIKSKTEFCSWMCNFWLEIFHKFVWGAGALRWKIKENYISKTNIEIEIDGAENFVEFCVWNFRPLSGNHSVTSMFQKRNRNFQTRFEKKCQEGMLRMRNFNEIRRKRNARKKLRESCTVRKFNTFNATYKIKGNP